MNVYDTYRQLVRWFYTRWNGVSHPKPEPAFYQALQRVNQFDTFAKGKVCPGCRTEATLQSVNYEVGSESWELTVRCTKCGLRGLLNPTGFRFEKSERRVT